jgi:hypothetical protein
MPVVTKKQQVLETLTRESGKGRSWKSRDDIARALGFVKSVSPLLNHLVAEGKVEQGEWKGVGKDGRLCHGYRPALPRPAVPAEEALRLLEDVRSKLDELAHILRRVA